MLQMNICSCKLGEGREALATSVHEKWLDRFVWRKVESANG